MNSSGAGVTIHDGFIEGMGENGIFARVDSRLRNLTVRSNAGNGVLASSQSVDEHVVVTSNGGSGNAGNTLDVRSASTSPSSGVQRRQARHSSGARQSPS